jgi:membrane-associated phospholipid phosphatase
MNIRITAILYKLRFFFILYLVLIAACLIIKLTCTREEIYFAVNARNWPWADSFMPYITHIGDGITTIILAVLLLFFVNYRKAFVLIGAYVLSSLTAQILKYIFDAPRPKLYFQGQPYKIHLITGIDQLSLHSFPSGHTVTIFSTTLVIAYWCNNKIWGIPLFLLAILVGYSRMYLSQHFFEDVTAGSVIGVVITAIWLFWTANFKFLKLPKWEGRLLKRPF